MKISFLAINFFFISIVLGAFAQSQSKLQVNTKKINHSHLEQIPVTRNCGTMESLAAEMEKDPSLKQRMDDLEKDLALREQSLANGGTEKVATLYKIPVVFHVVYSNALENISDAQIYSQLAVLNKDFRKQNPDVIQLQQVFSGLAADVEIEFCLASVDPNGVSTTGITRTSTSNNQGFSNQANDVKSNATGGKSPWNTSQYLNIWVCNLQGLLLGYAQFPGGSASTDGVVIDYAYFGTTGTATAPFNLGRTATHEVGHYLNLRHIWGDATCGDDFVNDTPTQQASNSQCPSFPQVTCNNGPNGDLFMNYMDYVDDACMYMFTNGQKSRMVAALTGSRSGLTTNTNINCTLPAPALICDTIANYPNTSFLTVYRTTDVSQPGTGYISGTNSFGDIGYAEKFNPLQPLQKIYGALIGFGKAYGFSTSTVNVKVWRADFAAGKPGTVAASIPVTIGQIVSDINNSMYSVVTFNNPVSVTSAYYIGIEFNPTNVDTVALYTTLVGQVATGKAYEQYDNGSWYPFTDATNSWGVNLSLAVKPIICLDYTGIDESGSADNEVQIFPNPSNGIYTMRTQLQSNEAIELNIYNSIGELVLSKKGELLNNGQLSFDLSMQVQGLYFVELKSETFSKVKKINLIH